MVNIAESKVFAEKKIDEIKKNTLNLSFKFSFIIDTFSHLDLFFSILQKACKEMRDRSVQVVAVDDKIHIL